MKYPMTPKVPTNDSSIRYRVLSYLPSSPEAHIGTNAEGGCETVHRLVVLPTQVEEDSQATLHIRVNGCRVQAHSCQEELFHFEKQGAGHGRKKKMQKSRWMDTSIFLPLPNNPFTNQSYPQDASIYPPSNPESSVPLLDPEPQSIQNSTSQVLLLLGLPLVIPGGPHTHSDNREPRMRLLGPSPAPLAPSSPAATRWA